MEPASWQHGDAKCLAGRGSDPESVQRLQQVWPAKPEQACSKGITGGCIKQYTYCYAACDCKEEWK